MRTNVPASIPDYIATFPPDVQEKLNQVRATIRAAAPDAAETIKYAMPTYVLNGNLVYFAGYKHHIGFYATPRGNAAFQQELAQYKMGKGSIQFPLDQPLPLDLIGRMVKFRVAENLAKPEKKQKTKSA